MQRVVGGAATCTWNLPATAKGKTFRGSVAVTFEGLRASQSVLEEGPLSPPPVRRLALLASFSQPSPSPGRRPARSTGRRVTSSSRRCTKVRRRPTLAHPTRTGNRVRVIVTLDDPPLAAATFARRLRRARADAKLNVDAAFSRSYLGRLETAQARAIASIRAEIPQAVVSRRYQVLVNGFAVSLPYERLPELLELDAVERVYPSY